MGPPEMIDALFRNTLAPWHWAVLAMIPPAIIALYFLKLKRVPLEVPSTYLWKRSIEDLHVNSLWQRIRQNLLMWLQLLLVAMAMLALLRPGWQGTKLEGERFIFLIDNSASMQAIDTQQAPDRLAEAKQRVRGLIDQMESGMTAMIISFAESPRVVQEFTDNRRLLQERIDSIQPTYGTTDLKGALKLADGLANPGRITVEEQGIEVDVVEAQEATVFIFSDGRFEDVKGFSLGNLNPIYVPIGSLEAPNLAMTTFTTRRSPSRPEQKQAFVQVVNFTDVNQSVVVEILLEDEFLDAKQVDINAGEATGVVFPLADAPPGALTAKLKYESDGDDVSDVLELDDEVYAALNEVDPGQVLLVTPGNVALEVSLETSRATRLAEIQVETPDHLTSDRYRQQADAGAYDLVIYDQCAPERMPRANTLFVGRLPPGPAWSGTASESPSGDGDRQGADEDDAIDLRVIAPQIIDWNRAHPLMAHVELGNVAIAESLVLRPPPGGDVLVDSTDGAILAVAPRDSYEDAVLGFEIIGRTPEGETTVNTNWARRHSFPTFWLNALGYLAGVDDRETAAGVQPGTPIELRVPGSFSELTVIGPDRQAKTIRRDQQDVFQYQNTYQLGIYEVLAGGQVVQRFAVNLFDRQESDIRVKPSQDPDAQNLAAAIRIGNIDVAAVTGATPARKETWKWILTLALVVLLVEWTIYNKRVYL